MGQKTVVRSEQPALSVIMPVYNAEKYVAQAIDSILSQSFRDFEFIIIDDCSTDSSLERIQGYDDTRIRLVKNESNEGVTRSLNTGLALARGRYIARMDADDVSVKHRFARQVDYMEKPDSADICGSWVWRLNQKKKYVLSYPVGKRCVEAFLLFGNPLAHPTVFMRREAINEQDLRYDPSCRTAQDYDLWSRCFNKCTLDNIREPLVKCRDNINGVTNTQFSQSNEVSINVIERMLIKLGIQLDKHKLLFHREIGNGSGVKSFVDLCNVLQWLEYLVNVNKTKKVFSHDGFLQAAAFAWYRVCLNSSGIGMKVINCYWYSPFRKWYRPNTRELVYLISNCVFKYRKLPTGRMP